MEDPPGRPKGTNSLLLLFLLVLLVAILAFWAWTNGSADSPTPASTAAPPSLPVGTGSP